MEQKADSLQEILYYKRDFVARAKTLRPFTEVRSEACDCPETRDFHRALSGQGVALIAEIKKASPSKGVIREDFNVEEIAYTYARHGANALSVLTDEAYFQGRDAYLQQARKIVDIPILRKDFTVDAYQLYEARVLGADAVLLIVAAMDGGQLEDFYGIGCDLGLAVLVEVHSLVELQRAIQVSADLIGINNRDLTTFTTDLEITFELMPHADTDALIVSESGINNRDHVESLGNVGVDAMLVGEALIRERDIGAKLNELMGR